jgi:hypothetical protein
MMKVIHYVRVSTDDQGNNFSIPGQLHELREHSKSEGHEVIAEIIDKGEKRHNLNRPGLDEIREIAQSQHVDEVWAWAWAVSGKVRGPKYWLWRWPTTTLRCAPWTMAAPERMQRCCAA